MILCSLLTFGTILVTSILYWGKRIWQLKPIAWQLLTGLTTRKHLITLQSSRPVAGKLMLLSTMHKELTENGQVLNRPTTCLFGTLRPTNSKKRATLTWKRFGCTRDMLNPESCELVCCASWTRCDINVSLFGLVDIV